MISVVALSTVAYGGRSGLPKSPGTVLQLLLARLLPRRRVCTGRWYGGKLTVRMREVLGGWVASNGGERENTTELVLEREWCCKTRERERD